MRTLRHPATIISIVALFLSLTGGAVAAVVITGKNVKNESLTSSDVKNGSLLSKDFKAGQLPAGSSGAAGSAGAKGAPGAAGSAGPAGIPGPKGDTGAKGDIGAKGDTGVDGRSALSVLQSGETIRGVVALDVESAAATGDWRTAITFPVPAPVAVQSTDVTVKDGADTAETVCAGTYAEPTAPAGRVCVYKGVASSAAIGTSTEGFAVSGAGGSRFGFAVAIFPKTTGDSYFNGSWAYTAP